MELNEYQKRAGATARKFGENTEALQYGVIGLAGETGELAEKIKKHLFHDVPLALPDVINELGDVLWSTAFIAAALGIDLDQVAQVNLAKLKKRHGDSYNKDHYAGGNIYGV